MRELDDRLKRLAKNANKRARKLGKTECVTFQELSRLWDATVFCSICGRFIREEDASLDHRIPLTDGGLNRIENISLVHYWCNNLKGDKDLMDANEEILATYPIEKTGIAFIDNLILAVLGPYASDRLTRSELPDDFGELSYMEQLRALDPDRLMKIEDEIMGTIRHGTVVYIGELYGRQHYWIRPPNAKFETKAVRDWLMRT
ncbi:MAG: HNH endonuclease [Chloroflexi bacterium]|nr:HNH endonuclease [Chloroflexota bacterium]